jgi:nitroreductase
MSVSHDHVAFRGAELDATLLRLAVGHAIRAPSSHNTQPWRFHIEGGSVELWADRTRALPHIDPKDRELTISCGAALFCLRIALRHFGYAPVTEILCEPPEPDLLARVTLGDRIVPTREDVELCDAIGRRRTNRSRYEDRPVPLDTVVSLRSAAEIGDAWIAMVQDRPRRHALAELIADADRRQWHDHEFRRELAAWLRSNRHGATDGMPGYALGRSDLAAAFSPLVVRTFDRGDGEAAHDLELADGAPLLAVFGTARDAPRDWVIVGEALSRTLLAATVQGLAASFLNQPLEVPELRPKVREIVGIDGAAQLIVRMGYPTKDVRPTPRRAVEDVLF